MLGNGSILLDAYIEVACCRDIISHPGGNTPATVMFDSGSIPVGYTRNIIALLCLVPCFFVLLVPLIPFPWPDATAPMSLTTPVLERSIIDADALADSLTGS